MLILVANLGSTSFKYKLYDMPSERLLAVGAADRIGQGQSAWEVEDGKGQQLAEGVCDLADHAASIELHLQQLIEHGVISAIAELDAIGFKAVHGGPISGAVLVDDNVIQTMERIAPFAPAHNPPYIAAMKSFGNMLPDVPQVACFETAFHADIPEARQLYGVPYAWATEHGVRRYGFHGASNAYIASRMAEIAPNCKKIINLHLGGSCSVCAIQDGKSVAHSMGSTPQTGLFHANRVGDFDAYAIKALQAAGVSEDEIQEGLSKQGGLLGLSGISADMREVREAAAEGNEQAQLAVQAFAETCRHYVGAYLAALNGADAIVFTAGVGQHDKALREKILKNLDFAGILLDENANQQTTGKDEETIHTQNSKVELWVVPTNEELIVARQTAGALQQTLI